MSPPTRATLAVVFGRSTGDASSLVECEGPVFTLAKTSLALAAISFGRALSAEDCLTNPAVHPLSLLDSVFVGLAFGHFSPPLIRL
jgi:hypothetical protein